MRSAVEDQHNSWLKRFNLHEDIVAAKNRKLERQYQQEKQQDAENRGMVFLKMVTFWSV